MGECRQLLQLVQRLDITRRDLFAINIWHSLEDFIENFHGTGPGRIDMRVIRPPHQIVDADNFPGEDGWSVIFNRGIELAAPHIMGAFTGELLRLESELPQNTLVHPV